MGAAATIPLQVQTPQIASPLQTISGLMSLRGDIANLALKQEQTRQAQQQTQLINAEQQQKNRDLADQNTIQDLMKDPTIGPQIAGGDTSPLLGKIQPKTLEALNTNLSALHAQKATIAETDLKNSGVALGRLTQALSGLQTTFGDDVGKINEALPSTIASLDAQGVFKDAGIDVSTLPKAISSPDDLRRMEAHLGVAQAINDKALEIKGIQTKQAQESAAAHEATAKAAHEEIVNKLIQGAGQIPTTGVHPIDQILPATLDKTGNTAAHAAYDEAMKMPPDENGRRPLAEKILEMASEHAAALSPQKRAAEVQTKVDEEKALAPLKEQQEIAARVGVAQAMNTAGPELAGVPIADRDKVRTDYQKSLTELATTASDANRIHGLITAAQGGNKAAPAVIPLAELRGFVNRVNQSELKSVTGAGSLIDKVQGWVQGKTEGQPIPPDILKATDDLAALQVENAQQKHAGEVQAINIARGAKLPAKKASDLGFAPIGVTTPASQAEFDALPKGAHFKKPGDTKEYIKQ
jgi:hypothetical protein